MFGDINRRKERLRRRLGEVQRKLAGCISLGLLRLEERLRRWWEEVVFQEETLWHQKSRIEWLKYGDRNT